MNTLSALGVAGALLLGASVPALAQSYPVDPGYDQGPAYGAGPADEDPDYGPPGARVEVLPPGTRYAPAPAYGGGYADGPYVEDDEVYAGQAPTYRREYRVYRRHREQPDDQAGGEARREGNASRPDSYRWPEGNFGEEPQVRERHAQQRRTRAPRPDEAESDAQ